MCTTLCTMDPIHVCVFFCEDTCMNRGVYTATDVHIQRPHTYIMMYSSQQAQGIGILNV